MSEKDRHDGQRRLVEDLEAKQKNTVWPGTLINGRGVDVFLWRGTAHPTCVQSMAAVLFGLLFIAFAIGFCGIASERHSLLLDFFSLGWLCLGVRVLFNSLPKRSRKHK